MHVDDKICLRAIGFALVYCVGVNERENHSSREKMFQSNIDHSMSIKMYIVLIQEIRVQLYGYFWVQSLCLLGACLWLGWVQSMRKLGACMRKCLGACMRMLGASLWNGWVHA